MPDTKNSNSLSRMFTISVSIITAGLLALLVTLPTTNAPSAVAAESEPSDQAPVAIVGARVFDGENWLADTTVLIEGGRIAALGSDVTLPDGTRRIDGSGHSVLPGLIDAHTHSYGDALSNSLRFGVTTNLDMFTAPSMLTPTRAARDSLANTELTDLFSAGMLATVEGGHGTQYGIPIDTLTADTDLDAWVARRKAEGSDYIKLVYMPYQNRIPSLDLELAKGVIDAAHAADLMAVAHTSSARATLDLIHAGIDGLVHIFADEPASTELIAAAKANDVFFIPTLSVLATADQQGEGKALAADPNVEAFLSGAQIGTLTSDFGFKVPTMTLAGGVENVRRLHAAGVRILAGSDAPNPGTTYGASLHQEMALLMRAGMSTTEVLRAATSLPASIFKLPQRGSLAVGQRADLLVVEGDPAADIRATRAIRHILRNGAEVRRELGSASSTRMASGAISNFAQSIEAPAGYTWSATHDGDMGGQSEASIAHVAPTVANPLGAVRVDGEVRAGFPWPWAGIYFGPEDGQPRDMSSIETLSLNMRGTPGTYRIMLFNAGSTGAPPTAQIDVTDQWQTFDIQIKDISGLNAPSVAGMAIVAGPAPGQFRFELADVSMK